MSSDAISSPSPVFLFGALRSGTMLMLKSRPGIQSPGEADFLFDHIEPTGDGGWRYDRAALERDRIFRAKHIAMPETGGTDPLYFTATTVFRALDPPYILGRRVEAGHAARAPT